MPCNFKTPDGYYFDISSTLEEARKRSNIVQTMLNTEAKRKYSPLKEVDKTINTDQINSKAFKRVIQWCHNYAKILPDGKVTFENGTDESKIEHFKDLRNNDLRDIRATSMKFGIGRLTQDVKMVLKHRKKERYSRWAKKMKDFFKCTMCMKSPTT